MTEADTSLEATTTVTTPWEGRGRSGLLRRMFARPGPLGAASFLGTLVILAAVAPYLPLPDPDAIDMANVLQGPAWGHWLGFDNLGRDILSRLVFSSQVSLAAAGIAMAVALVIGLPLGLLSGYFGGWWDYGLSRAIDALLAVPGLILILVIVAALQPGLTSAMFAIGVVSTPAFFRVVRASTLNVRNEAYIEAARISSASTLRILLRHVLPNISGPLLIQVALTMGHAIMVEAALSYIGLGVQPPQATWGSLLRQASQYIASAPPTYLLSPALMIIAAVLAFNTLADGLRSALSPRRGAQRT